MLTAGKALKKCLPRKWRPIPNAAARLGAERRCSSLATRKSIPRLIITDQPGFAADVARLLRLKNVGENLEQGYFGEVDSQRDVVAWCYGNAFSIVDPVIEPKQWRLSQLPFFPALDDVPPSGPSASEHLQVLAELMASAEMVICAMEPTSSGQLLFQDILNHVRSKLNVNLPESKLFRIWLHDRSRDAVRLALKEPYSNDLFKNFAKSAHLRRFVDWSTQYNYSKLYTLLYSRHSSQVFQLGRVQLLLLRKVTERYLERREFQPKPFYEIHLDCLVQGNGVVFKWTKDTSNLVPYDSVSESDDLAAAPETEATTIEKPRQIFRKSSRYHSIDSKEEAHQIAHSLEPTSIIVGHKMENVHQPPPLLYNLTSLQREAYERYSIPASATHVALQALYEKYCLISNPSTASHQLPLHKMEEIEETLNFFGSMRKYSAAASMVSKDKGWQRLTSHDPRVFDSLLAPHDSHAIIPAISNFSKAKKREAGMTSTMTILYDMVIRRFLAAMMPDMVHSMVTVTLENADKYYFEARAAILKSEGWKLIGALPKAKAPFNPGPSNFPTGYIASSVGEDEEETQEELVEQKQLFKAFSALRLGDELKGFVPAAVITKETSPPPLYTQSKVLSIMEEKSTLISDLDHSSPSALSSSSESLKQPTIISNSRLESHRRKGKTLKQENGLARPEERADLLTKLISAKWLRTRQDRYLEPTRKGILLTKLIQDDAISNIVHSQSWDNTLALIAKGKGSSSSAFIQRFKSVIQPDVSKYISGSPSHTIQSDTNYPNSGESQVSSISEEHRKMDSDSSASLTALSSNSTGSIELAYDLIYYHTNTAAVKALNQAPALATTRCPKCHSKGHLKQGPTAYFCAAPKCNFTMPQVLAGKLLTNEEAKTLIQGKQPSRFTDLVDPAGNTFEATVVLQPPYFRPFFTEAVITKAAEPKTVSSGSGSLPIRRSRDDMLGSTRIVSGLSGPGRPTRGTSLKKMEKPKGQRGRPALPEEALAERIRQKVDRELTRAMAKQAKEEKLRQKRENPVVAPSVRVDAHGNVKPRGRGRPRVGEFIPKKPKRPSVGRPKLTEEELQRRAALKRPRGRPSTGEVLRKLMDMQKQLGQPPESIDIRSASKKLAKRIARARTTL
jgi:DNA topoisomerase IA